ncbi:MAG: hypothetical protein ACRDTJ_04400 [Pseudonocardiaceae bacterium]
MSTAPAEPTPTEPTSTEPPAAAATPPTTPPPTPPPTTPPAEPKANVWEDPKAAEAEIKRLRQENGAARTNAKAQAATDAKNELAQTIGKALGLVKDEPIDPAKLTESLTASQAEAKQARVELAVFRSATSAGGDPAALLDSSSFLRSLDAIDPADSAAVSAAIQAAVTANPRLGAESVGPRLPAPNPAQGSSAAPPPTPEELAAQAASQGDWKKSMALKADQLLSIRDNTNR